MVVYLLDLVEPSTLWYGKLRLRRAGVAQSVEQRFCKPQVGGSIPLASSISSKNLPISAPSCISSMPVHVPILSVTWCISARVEAVIFRMLQ